MLEQQQGVDVALNLRAARQAERSSVDTQEQAVSLRTLGIGTTESNLTVDTRAVRLATTGSAAGDEFFESDTGWRYRWSGTVWAYETGVYVASEATRTGLSISSADNNALLLTTDNSSSGLILWEVVAGVWTKRLSIVGTTNQITASVSGGVLTISLPATIDITTSYKVNGNKVVGARGAGVTDVGADDASDLASAITLANETKAQFNTLLSRLRSSTGHGLFT